MRVVSKTYLDMMQKTKFLAVFQTAANHSRKVFSVSQEYRGVCCKERMLQRTVFINKTRMIQRTQMLQRTRRNTIGRHSTRVRMTCSIIVFTRERLLMLFMCVRLFMLFIRESLFIVLPRKECSCFPNLHAQCIK